MVKKIFAAVLYAFLLFCLARFFSPGSSYTQDSDPLDPFSFRRAATPAPDFDPSLSHEADKNRNVDDLLDEASRLLEQEERPLDARTKLLTALQRAPHDYRPYMLLCAYYMDVVGHFRLALKYALRAMQLFTAANGKPPYENLISAYQHGHLLYLLSQSRLNLDDYQGALSTLDQYASYGYYRDWYAGSRAWVLMKLGRLEEAIKVARMGILAGSEPGRILNMLGILLSMTGKRIESLDVLDRATSWELSLGKAGRPATPLNNAGEVYDEIFQEKEAETSWLRATSLHDGCEHVLPSLNLALLYLDQNRPADAERAMDSFEGCMAQYPLRNGEEHRALVHLARGRIALQTGSVDAAILHFNETLAKRQWFGKIGTSQKDLKTAGMISLAQALRAKNHHLRSTRFSAFSSYAAALIERFVNEFRARWLMRRARQILSEDLNFFEDLYIRNTDSMLEYPSLGEVLAQFPLSLARRLIAYETAKDQRPQAQVYYQAYLAESLLRHGRKNEGFEKIEQVLQKLRDGIDEALKIHLLLLKLENFTPGQADYARLANRIFSLSRAALRNGGFKLTVNWDNTVGGEIARELESSMFHLDNSNQHPYRISAESVEGAYTLKFKSAASGSSQTEAKASTPAEAANKLAFLVFSENARILGNKLAETAIEKIRK